MRELKTRKAVLAGLLLAAMLSGQAQPHEHHAEAMEGHWMAPAKEAKRHNPVKPTPE
jgi:hypothetical protein